MWLTVVNYASEILQLIESKELLMAVSFCHSNCERSELSSIGNDKAVIPKCHSNSYEPSHLFVFSCQLPYLVVLLLARGS